MSEPLWAPQLLAVVFTLVGVEVLMLCAVRIRRCRRAGVVGQYVSVMVNHTAKHVQVACDGGRVCRPLIVVENGKPRLTVRLFGCLVVWLSG